MRGHAGVCVHVRERACVCSSGCVERSLRDTDLDCSCVLVSLCVVCPHMILVWLRGGSVCVCVFVLLCLRGCLCVCECVSVYVGVNCPPVPASGTHHQPRMSICCQTQSVASSLTRVETVAKHKMFDSRWNSEVSWFGTRLVGIALGRTRHPSNGDHGRFRLSEVPRCNASNE